MNQVRIGSAPAARPDRSRSVHRGIDGIMAARCMAALRERPVDPEFLL